MTPMMTPTIRPTPQYQLSTPQYQPTPRTQQWPVTPGGGRTPQVVGATPTQGGGRTPQLVSATPGAGRTPQTLDGRTPQQQPQQQQKSPRSINPSSQDWAKMAQMWAKRKETVGGPSNRRRTPKSPYGASTPGTPRGDSTPLFDE